MLFYTVTIVFSLLVAIPVIILIYQTDSLANKAVADSIFHDRTSTTDSTSAQKFRVKPVKLDDAKSIMRRKQLDDTPDHEEKPASVDTPLKIVANEVPKIVAEASNSVADVPKIVAEAPNSVADVPKIVAKVPMIVTEAPKLLTEEPKIVAETPKSVTEVPKDVAEMPHIVSLESVLKPFNGKISANTL